MTNNKTQLVVFTNDYQVTNKELNTNLKKMLEAMNRAEKSTWDYARALYNIIKDELYKDDFKTLKAFGEKLGISAPIMTRVKNGVPNMETLSWYGYNENNITLSKSYILFTLGENQTAFLNYAKDNNIKLDVISESKMVSIIKEYLNKNNEAVENEEPNEEQEPNE